MAFLEKKGVAIGFLILCILFSVFILGGNHLNKQKKALFTAFEEGVPGVGFTAADQVEHIKGQGLNMVTVLKSSDTDYDKTINRLEECAKKIDNGKSPDEKIIGAMEMYTVIFDVYSSEVDRSSLDDKGKEYIIGIWAEADAGVRFIITSGYQAMAADFNQQLKGFPASLISSVRGLQAATVYQITT